MISVKTGEDLKTASVAVKELVVSLSPFLKGKFHLKITRTKMNWRVYPLLTAVSGIL